MKKVISCIICFFTISIVVAQPPILTQQIGHAHLVTSTATDPNHKLAASSSIDNTIKIWDLETGKLLYTLKGHGNAVTKCVFSDNGKYIFTASLDKVVKQWNTENGTLVRTFTGHNSGISALALSNNNKAIAAGSWDGTIKLWSVQSGAEVIAYRKHKEKVNALCFSADDKLLGSGSEDKNVVLWDITKSEPVPNYNKNDDEVVECCFIYGTNYFASLSNDNVIRIFDYLNQEQKQLIANGEQLQSLIPSATGKTIYSIANKNIIKGWDVESGNPSYSKKTAFTEIDHLSLDNFNKYFLASHQQTMVRIDFATGQKLMAYEGYSPIVATVDVSSDRKYIASGNRDNTIRLWQMDNGREVEVLAGHQDDVEAVQFSPDNKLLASASKDKTIRIWQLSGIKNKEAIATISGHSKGITSIDFRIDGKYIASGSSDNTVRLWKVATGENVRTFTGHTNRVHSVSLSTDGNFIASGSWDKTIKIWDVHNNQLLHTINGHEGDVWSVDFNNSGTLLVSGSADGTIKFWNTTDGTLVKSLIGHTDHVKSVSFSADGKQIVSGSWDNTIKIWDVQSSMLLKTLKGHSNYVRSVAFSPDNKYIISGSSDSQMKIWDIATEKELLSAITFSNGNDHVITTPQGYFDGTPEGIKKTLHYVVGNTVIPLDAFFEKYYTPNLWERIISGEKIEDNTKKEERMKMPPLVEITQPKDNSTSNNEVISVAVEVTDMGGGIDEIRLYHNNKLVSNSTRGFKPVVKKGEKKIEIFKIHLLPGSNKLKATAFNNERTEALPHTITVNYGDTTTAEARLFLFTIGINEYKNNIYNLNFAIADADAIAETIKLRGQSIFKEIHRYDLRNSDATKENIESEFLKIQNKATANDVFVFFYAGHGAMGATNDKKDFFIIPHEVTQIYGNDELLQSKGIASELLMGWSKNIKAQKQLILLDACQSGGAVEHIASRGVAEQKALMQLARSTGVAVIASSGTQQYASEFGELKHGVFSYSLLEAISGKADGGRKDKKITVNEIRAYLDDRVPELTKQYRGQSQYPTAYSRGQDFPLSIGE